MAVIKPNELEVRKSQIFFFDTNIWLLIFAPVGNSQKRDQSIYSSLLQRIINRNSIIFINSIIISEFSNVLLRFEFNLWKSNSGLINLKYKKDFVGTDIYKQSVENVKLLMNKILEIEIVERVSDGFNGINIENVFNYFGSADFNDAYISELAIQNNYLLVTNDKDFKNFEKDLTIITTK